MGALNDARLPFLTKRRLIILGCIALAVYFAASGILNQLDTRSLDEEQVATRAEVAELQTRKETLERLREYLSSSEFVVEEARRTLGFVMPGETQIIVVGPEAPEQDASGKAWWEALFDYGEASPTPSAP